MILRQQAGGWMASAEPEEAGRAFLSESVLWMCEAGKFFFSFFTNHVCAGTSNKQKLTHPHPHSPPKPSKDVDVIDAINIFLLIKRQGAFLVSQSTHMVDYYTWVTDKAGWESFFLSTKEKGH